MVKIYVEGGGDQDKLKRKCRKAFGILIENSGLKGTMPRIVACGSREATFRDFCNSIEKTPSFLSILLVDSEELVEIGDKNNPWNHLKKRDNWDKPAGVSNEQVHLMVVCMESWFLADKEVLKDFYGKDFLEKKLSQNNNIENISKKDVFSGLEKATNKVQNYNKGKHSFDILEKIDLSKLEQNSFWAKRFFDYLRSLRGI